MIRLVLVLSGMLLLCSGCSHVMSEALLKQTDATASYTAVAAKPDSFIGKWILTGGILAHVTGGADVTTLEVAQLGLYSNGVPDESSASGGRFLAVSTELIDPVVYRPGSLVTIIGEVKGKKVQVRDGADYPYPYLTIKEIRFFRPTRDMPDTNANPYRPAAGDDRFIRTPPGLPGGEPRKFP